MKKGFTLVEALIGLVIFSLVISLLGLYQRNSRLLVEETKLKGMVSLEQNLGLDELSKDLSLAETFIFLGPNKVTFDLPRYNEHFGKVQKEVRQVSYELDVFRQEMAKDYEVPRFGLVRVENGIKQPVVYYFGANPNDLAFKYYDDKGVLITYGDAQDKLVEKIEVSIRTKTRKQDYVLMNKVIIRPLKGRDSG